LTKKLAVSQETLIKTLLSRKKPSIEQGLPMKRTALAIVLIVIVSLSITTWFVHNQINDLQNQINELHLQNSAMQDQNSDLQEQVNELQLQNREKQDRLIDFTHELAKARHLHVEITDYSKGGGGAIGGLTFVSGIYVTIQNNDVIPVSGLTIKVELVDKDKGVQIGDTGVTNTGRLNAGESGNFSVSVLYNMSSLSLIYPAEVVIVLTAGNVVLDQLDTRELT
jgi:cell division protein FtsL